MNLDTGKWKEFLLGDIFEIKKGKRLTSADQTEGTTPYIGAIDSNNGLANYIGQNPIHAGNTISLSYNGSIGEAYYQPEPFWATDDVNVLYFKKENNYKFNRNIGLFFCTILKLEKEKWSYGRKWDLEYMQKTIVKLPVKHNEDGFVFSDENKIYLEYGFVPDWEFMENYIKSLHSKPITTNNNNKKNYDLSDRKWKECYLNDFYFIEMGNKFDENKMTDENPEINFVTRREDNNGISGKVDYIKGNEPYPAGLITIALGGSLGSCFIQDAPFYTAQNIVVLKPKYNEMSKFVNLFIITLIKYECKIRFYPFGRELNAYIKHDFKIKLPTDQHNNIDWEFMENYIKSLPYGDRI